MKSRIIAAVILGMVSAALLWAIRGPEAVENEASEMKLKEE